jgi:hypothetical protein
LYGHGEVRKSVDKINKEVGSLSVGAKLLVAASTYFAALPLLLLFPATPILLSAAAVAGLSMVMASRYLSYRAAAKDARLTPKDVRYVVKTMKLLDREEASTQTILLNPELKGIRANLKGFHERFNKQAAALKGGLSATLAAKTIAKRPAAVHHNRPLTRPLHATA